MCKNVSVQYKLIIHKIIITSLNCPRPGPSFRTSLLKLQLLLCGDVEANPGPAFTVRNSVIFHNQLHVGSLNPCSAVNKTKLVLLNVIDEQALDVLAVTDVY